MNGGAQTHDLGGAVYTASQNLVIFPVQATTISPLISASAALIVRVHIPCTQASTNTSSHPLQPVGSSDCTTSCVATTTQLTQNKV
jgi:hypothetical protein